jgi:hypothetical protein
MPKRLFLQVLLLLTISIVIFKFSNLFEKEAANQSKQIPAETEGLLRLTQRVDLVKIIEIGVREGEFAEVLLSSRVENYYGIDPWRAASNNYDKIALEAFNTTKRRLEKFGNRVELLRMISSEAVTLFKDHSVDFVYIDGRHDYCGVEEDIRLYWPKLRRGGVLSGHGE